MSVLVLPYRHPLYWAKIAVTIDQLSKGRLIMGIGVGWMEEEFEAMGIPFRERGAISDEQLQVVSDLWTQEHCGFNGRYYRFQDVAFLPKPVRGTIPIWVGGEGLRAQRRAGAAGDAWFPYFVRVTPQQLGARFENVRRAAIEAKRDPDCISLNCCLPIEMTDAAVAGEEGCLKGNCEQIYESLVAYERAGVQHLALQFMVPHWPERMRQIQTFADKILPEFKKGASPASNT
jgi:probable F420-dependent oxidoreductase